MSPFREGTPTRAPTTANAVASALCRPATGWPCRGRWLCVGSADRPTPPESHPKNSPRSHIPSPRAHTQAGMGKFDSTNPLGPGTLAVRSCLGQCACRLVHSFTANRRRPAAAAAQFVGCAAASAIHADCRAPLCGDHLSVIALRLRSWPTDAASPGSIISAITETYFQPFVRRGRCLPATFDTDKYPEGPSGPRPHGSSSGGTASSVLSGRRRRCGEPGAGRLSHPRVDDVLAAQTGR
jgi:hypothetical protein